MPYMVLSLKEVFFRHRQELLSAHEEQEADKFADVVSIIPVCAGADPGI